MKNPLIKYIFANHFLFTVLLLFLTWILFQIRSILIGLFISYIITAALSPFVDFLQKKKIPKIIAVVIPYFFFIFLLVVLILPVIPFFISQIQALLLQFPVYLNQVAKVFNVSLDTNQLKSIITSDLSTIGQNAFFITSKVFGGIFSLLSIFVVAFYLLLDRNVLHNAVVTFFPKHMHGNISLTIKQIEEKLGAWLRGQLILSLVIGIITWVFLSLIGLNFALSLAIIAGILEIIPTIGPIIGSVPAIIVAFTVSPTMALGVGVLYFIIQMLENNILVPRIMGKAVGLNPIVVILGVLVGGELIGVMGALLSIPMLAIVIVVFNSFRHVYQPS